MDLNTGYADFTKPELKLNPRRGLSIKTRPCRHGTFTWYEQDELIGLALDMYGEYSEDEVQVFRNCLRPGHVVLDVGANIGAFTVPMSQLVGELGHVIAIEANPDNVIVLNKNLYDNDCSNVAVCPLPVGENLTDTIELSNQDALHAYSRPELNKGQQLVKCITIDSMNIAALHFMKIDVEPGQELAVLKGAEKTIARCRPIIYVENEHPDTHKALIAWLADHDYRMYWHRPFHYHRNNFRLNKHNIFGSMLSIMMLCVPNRDDWQWGITNLEEVSDLRDDDLMFMREIERYGKIVNKHPDDLMSRWLIAHYSNLMQLRDVAEAAIDENLIRDPEHGPSRALRGMFRLQDGDWKTGWPLFEMRYLHNNLVQFGGNRTHPCPQWDGTPTDEPVLIWCEQGFGDQIMFARFFGMARDRAPNAFMEISPELYELFDQSRMLLGLPEFGDLYRMRRRLPEYSYHCSMPSLPHILGDLDDPYLRTSGPYLEWDTMAALNWMGMGNNPFVSGRDPLNGARIGLCSRGSPTSERPYTRDLPPEQVARLVKEVPLFPLEQQGQFESYATTAAAIGALHHVITVDTSIAHLAGALGKKTTLLLSYDPDWRWGLHDETTVWYDSVRIIRQPRFRDWDSVIDQVIDELK